MRFPIAEAINAGRCLDTGVNKPSPSLPDVAFVNCDAVSSYYWQAETDGFDLRTNEFGIIKPPYPAMYLEWAIPPRVFADGKWMDRREAVQEGHAAFVITCEDEHGKGFMSINTITWDRGQVLKLPFIAAVGYDEHGVYRQLESAAWNAAGFSRLDSDDENKGPQILVVGEAVKRMKAWGAQTAVTETVACWYNMVCLAISFMHCRSSGVDWVTVPPKVTATRERRGIKGPTQYGYIKVPAGLSARTSTRKDRIKATEGQMSAHWVRGHFKTYTPDAPLFGSRTGSWWWQPTIRGIGEATHKPYEVAPVGTW